MTQIAFFFESLRACSMAGLAETDVRGFGFRRSSRLIAMLRCAVQRAHLESSLQCAEQAFVRLRVEQTLELARARRLESRASSRRRKAPR